MWRSEPVGLTRTNGSTLYYAIDDVYLFKTLRTAKHKKKSEALVVFHDEFVHVVQCCSIKCKIANHKYCHGVLWVKLFTPGDIELNPGPVTQGNNLTQEPISRSMQLYCIPVTAFS